MTLDKIAKTILFICLPIYVIMTVYYTMLVYNFSGWGIFVTFTLTILPTVGGIYFGYEIKKRKNEN